MRGSCQPATRVRIDQAPVVGKRLESITGGIFLDVLCAPNSQRDGLTKGRILATKSVEVSPDLQPRLIHDYDGTFWVMERV